jgi:hypothetical protein
MALVTFTDGPLDGQEKELADPTMFASEHPGYSLQEQTLDSERGQIMKATWGGDQAAEAHYPGSPQEAERAGNETGVRDKEAQQRSAQQEAGRGEQKTSRRK